MTWGEETWLMKLLFYMLKVCCLSLLNSNKQCRQLCSYVSKFRYDGIHIGLMKHTKSISIRNCFSLTRIGKTDSESHIHSTEVCSIFKIVLGNILEYEYTSVFLGNQSKSVMRLHVMLQTIISNGFCIRQFHQQFVKSSRDLNLLSRWLVKFLHTFEKWAVASLPFCIL